MGGRIDMESVAGFPWNRWPDSLECAAVARKLAVLLHHLWVTGQEYEPLYLASQQDQAA